MPHKIVSRATLGASAMCSPVLSYGQLSAVVHCLVVNHPRTQIWKPLWFYVRNRWISRPGDAERGSNSVQKANPENKENYGSTLQNSIPLMPESSNITQIQFWIAFTSKFGRFIITYR